MRICHCQRVEAIRPQKIKGIIGGGEEDGGECVLEIKGNRLI